MSPAQPELLTEERLSSTDPEVTVQDQLHDALERELADTAGDADGAFMFTDT